LKNASPGEAQRTSAKKKHPKKKQLRNATLKEANMRNGEKVQIRPGTNWTNMISEKSCKTLGKSKQNAKKKQEKCNKSAKKCKSDLGPNWTNVEKCKTYNR
jgi:hypothetical protein